MIAAAVAARDGLDEPDERRIQATSLCEMGDHGLDLRVAVERLEALLAAVA